MKKMLFALAPAALLAACSSNEPAPPADNAVEMLDVTNEAMNVEEAPLVMNTPEPVVENTPAPAPLPDREQIQHDADATGMTARVNREEEPANATQPAERE
ncbi:hypothetical protein [Sphingomonas sp.]|uniref:hypothetical protein n=1 Tax=Sphingomonas sp. TaxID=28214 RepID=UPI002DD6691C|nr:hypothetical protein [Sphingomonas sp.]